MLHIVDRRLNPSGKSLPNRMRFWQRMWPNLLRAWNERLRFESITGKDDNEIIHITGDLGIVHEPVSRRSPFGGVRDYLLPGNKEYVAGDSMSRPMEEQKEEGEIERRKENGIYIPRGEFFQYLLEHLQLPEPGERKSFGGGLTSHAGYGPAQNGKRVSLMRTLETAMTRRVAGGTYGWGTIEQARKDVEREITRLVDEVILFGIPIPEIRTRLVVLKEHDDWIADKITRREDATWFEELDKRIRLKDVHSVPIGPAVMFVLMNGTADVGEDSRDIAIRSAAVLYRLIKKRHENLDVVFIRYGEKAEVVPNEKEAFSCVSPGEPVVWKAYEKMLEVAAEKYGAQNCHFYGLQICNGQLLAADLHKTSFLMREHIWPVFQRFLYVETASAVQRKNGMEGSVLWNLLGFKPPPHFNRLRIVARTAILPALFEIFPAPDAPRDLTPYSNAPKIHPH